MKVIYICYSCQYHTNFKGDMKKHVNNLKGCSPTNGSVSETTSKEEIQTKSLTPFYCDEYGMIIDKNKADDLKKKNLECNRCQKKFSTKYKLNRHVSTSCHIKYSDANDSVVHNDAVIKEDYPM